MKRWDALVAAAATGMLMIAGPAFSQGSGKQPNWQTVEADNGAIYKIDTNSISHNTNGTADAIVYAVEGADYNPQNIHRFFFDCRGRFSDITGPGFSSTEYAPPRSIVGRLAEIACAGAKDTRLEDASRPQPKDTPDHYCAGFSREACARITAAAEATPKPAFCKPGFGLVGSRLSDEQIRICHVIANEEFRLEEAQKSHAPDTPSRNRSYDLKVSATQRDYPLIVGSTNLPDGTKLIVTVDTPHLPNAAELAAAGLPRCEGGCKVAQGPKGHLGETVTVEAGAFAAGPFSWDGKPFQKGAVEVDVYFYSWPDEEAAQLISQGKVAGRMEKPILTTSVVITPPQ